MNHNKKLLILLIVLLICLIVGTSYALFNINDEQEGKNTVTSGCINVTFENQTGTLSIDKAYPMSDSDGQKLTGYSFKLVNKCDSEVAYVVNLDVFNVADVTNLGQGDIILGIDNYVARDLNQYKAADKNSADATYAKNIYSGVLKGKEEYTHTIKLWVDENVGNEFQNAKFQSQVFVIAGQDIIANSVTPDECFIVNDTGDRIVRYKNYYCPDDVIVPRYINGVEITGIEIDAFNTANVLSHYDWDTDVRDYVILDEENFDVIKNVLINNIYAEEEWASQVNYIKASDYTAWDNFTLFDYAIEDVYYLLVPIHMTEESASQQYSVTDFKSGYYPIEECSKGINSLDLSQLKNLKSIRQISHRNNDLAFIELPEGLEKIEEHTFVSGKLTKVYFPTTLKEIKNSAFYRNKISRLEFNSEVAIATGAFSNNNLTNLIINRTLTIHPEAFANNPNLLAENIKIGYYSQNNVEEIINSASLTSE